MALSTSKKELERVYTCSLIANLKSLEQKEANTGKRSRSQQIIKLRIEINDIEMKNYITNQRKKN